MRISGLPTTSVQALLYRRLHCYIAAMVDTLTDAVMPSATPTEEEIAAWQELPRDEQLRRMRQMLTSREASTPCNTTMAEIWAEIDSDAPEDG
jgi:hypothetical protein